MNANRTSETVVRYSEQRFDRGMDSYTEVVRDDDGEFVFYEDYASLLRKFESQSAELASLRARCDAAEKLIDKWRQESSASRDNFFTEKTDDERIEIAKWAVYGDCADELVDALTAERAKEGETK